MHSQLTNEKEAITHQQLRLPKNVRTEQSTGLQAWTDNPYDRVPNIVIDGDNTHNVNHSGFISVFSQNQVYFFADFYNPIPGWAIHTNFSPMLDKWTLMRIKVVHFKVFVGSWRGGGNNTNTP